MSSFDTSTTSKIFCFVTLKVSQDFIGKASLTQFFKEKDFCDVFIKCLVHFIENKKLELFGFVITSDQIHLIVESCKGEIANTIRELKNKSAREMIHLMGKNLNSMDDRYSRKNIEMRKIFNGYLNGDETIFWQKKTRPIEITIHHEGISPISSNLLKTHLDLEDRNYFQLGATAFTRLMMDTMKI